jgi:hypothetical protein
MTCKRVVFISVLMILIGCAVLMVGWSARRMSRVAQQKGADGTGADQSTAGPALLSENYKVPNQGPYRGLDDPRWVWWNKMKDIDKSFEWKMPIEFYGRVIDGEQQPVTNASVQFQWTDMSPTGTSTARSESDAQGLFSISGRRGKRLEVHVTKDGYHSEGGLGGKSFEYAAFFEGIFHRPDPNHPVLFVLTKKLPAEHLIAKHIFTRGSYERPNYYDIVRGTISQLKPPTGLEFVVTRGESPQGQPFPWTAEIRPVNAGILESAEEYPQMAPQNGYNDLWSRTEAESAEPFIQTVKTQLYVKTNDGRYAVVRIELSHPNLRSEGLGLDITSYLNPSGSRNIDHDPTKVVRVQ